MRINTYYRLVFVCILMTIFNIFARDLIIFYCSILSTVLVSYFIVQERVNLFNPLTLFTFYYFTAIPVYLYLHFTDFDNSLYFGQSDTNVDLSFLLGLSLLYMIAGYVFTLLGYKFFEKRGTPNINFDDGISLKVVNVFTLLFAIVGIINFSYNVLIYAGGNPLVYLSNIAIRKLEFEEIGGTTLGYHFGFTAAYLWYYKLLKTNKRSYFFVAYVFLTIIIKATTGRVTSTLFYALTFVAVYYIVNLKKAQKYNKRYLILFVAVCFIGILLFLLRVVSSMSFNEMLDGGWLLTLFSLINFDQIMFLAVDMGNAPNIAVFMKIINSWGRDIGFLYGSSLLSWFYSIIPASLRPEEYQVSFMIRNTWYPNMPGSLPPTGIGEMYANFGILGPFLGMFIFGGFIAIVHNLLHKFNNYWFLIIFINISLYFIMIYPKGEFDNMSFLHIVPMLFTYLLLSFFTKLLEPGRQYH